MSVLASLAINHPTIIQGGMGIGVSHWKLARAVSLCGGLGVVSGTSADSLLVRRLQDGDEGGHLRRAMSFFPDQEVVKSVLEKFFKPEGRKEGEPYKLLPMYTRVTARFREMITMLGTFVEVYLAKEDHTHPVGMNLLTKIQLPTIASIYGGLLAGMDYLLMGAGIPKEIPAVIEGLCEHREVSIKLDVEGESSSDERLTLNPEDYFPKGSLTLKKPFFLPIVSSHTLATMFARKFKDTVAGFIVEGPLAGGHNAPPRDGLVSPEGEPVYGERDEPDLSKIKELGKPFWLAGGTANKASLEKAQQQGAVGVQVGTLFALSNESGIASNIKEQILGKVCAGTAKTFTDALASPTGFPFKVVGLENSASEKEVYENRPRKCDLGYLRTAYRRADGTLGFRCPAEPVEDYLKKGGAVEETASRKCICNGLLSTIGRAQVQARGFVEPYIVTAGNIFDDAKLLAERNGGSYSAKEAVEYLLSGIK